MAGEVNVGTISGKIELDAASVAATLGEVNTKLDLLGAKLDKGGTSVKDIAEGFIGAEAAMKAFHTVVDLASKELEFLVEEGGRAEDIRGAFDHLTEGAGLLGDTLLTKVRAGVQGMVSDVDIMKRVNSDLAAGLKLTTDQYELIGQASFRLAQAEGISVADAFDRVSDAMVTGRTRGIALLTGRIDQEEAERKYAESLGTTSDMLNQAGKVEASRVAILESLRGANDRLGETELNVGDKVEQAKVKFENFNLELGESVAASPVLITALDSIGSSFTGAFGGKDEMIKTVTSLIEDGAIVAVDFGIAVTAALDGTVGAFEIAYGVVEEFYGGLKAIWDFAHGDFKEAADDLKLGLDDIVKGATGQTELQQALRKTEAALFSTRDAMVSAKAQADANRAATDGLKDAHEGAAHATANHNTEADKLNQTYSQTPDQIKKAAAAMKEMAEVGVTWRETIQGIDGETVEAVKYYLQAGIAQDKLAAAYQLTDVQVKAISDSMKAEIEGYKVLTAAVEKEQQAEEKLVQTRISIAQNSIKTQMQDDIAAVQARYDAGLINERSYQAQILAIKSDYAQKAEALYREQADSEVKAVQDSLDKQLAALEKDYEQGKIDHDDYEKTKTALTRAAADDRAAIEDKYTADRKQRTHDANEDAKAGFTQVGQVGKQSFEVISEGVANLSGGVDLLNKKVLTLSGELMDAVKYKELLNMGGSSEVTSANFAKSLTDYITSYGYNQAGIGVQEYRDPYQLAKAGYSWQEILRYAFDKSYSGGTLPPPQGPRIPGFKEGGVGDFGDGTLAMLHGQEIITPIDKVGQVFGGTQNNYFNITGADERSARTMADIIIRQLKTQHQFGAA